MTDYAQTIRTPAQVAIAVAEEAVARLERDNRLLRARVAELEERLGDGR